MKPPRALAARISALRTDEQQAIRAVAQAAQRSEHGGTPAEAARADLATIRAQLVALQIARHMTDAAIRSELQADRAIVALSRALGPADNGTALMNAQARIVSWTWVLTEENERR